MSRDPYLHELDDFSSLLQIEADERGIIPQLVEKDYWIMQSLFGLTQQNFNFELKGGTSLSKGFGIIQRFSEDIDIRIDPDCAPFEVAIGKNQTNKSHHIQSRKKFYDWLADNIRIDGIVSVERDHSFDDQIYRSGGIRLNYKTLFGEIEGLKDGILLEVGFDDTTPNENVTISSWAYDKATSTPVAVLDNQAKNIKCYHPGYTFVEKLQAISTKFRQQQESNNLPSNFLRHYYDVSQLLEYPSVQSFIGTTEYHERKNVRFRKDDEINISENEAFLLSNSDTRNLYRKEFLTTSSLYYEGLPDFDNIISKIQAHIDRL
ncbi:MAG: nucleotidyl transferase AbiEii/AbiGii toxin family protein [Thiohalomonadales bacterium]